MLPRTRTMLVATFVTAMLVTVVGTTIVPVPADSYVNRMALPRVEPPPPEHARMVSSKEQSRMAAYSDDELNKTRPVESLSNASKTMEGGTSTYAKSQAGSSEDHVERSARSSPSVPSPEQAASNSDTKRAVVAAMGNTDGASIATAESPVPHVDAAVLSTTATSSARSDCEQSNGRIGFHGFRPAHYRLHAHHPRLRGWHRTWASRRVIARSTPRGGPPTYSAF
jgi:cytoskeletal protein RodZ